MEINKMMLPSQKEIEKENLGYSLNFISKLMRQKYRIYIVSKLSFSITLQIFFVGLFESIYLIFFFGISPEYSKDLFILCLILGAGVPIMFYASSKLTFGLADTIYNEVFVDLILIGSIFLSYTLYGEYSVFALTILSFLSLRFRMTFTRYTVMIIVSLVGYFAILWTNYSYISRSWSYCYECTNQGGFNLTSFQYPLIILSFQMICVVVLFYFQRFKTERLLKEVFKASASLDNNSLMAKDLFRLLLPKFILDCQDSIFEIREHHLVQDECPDVTILFCDIADFDEVVLKNEHEIVSILDRLFRKFDDKCALQGLQKIETVGKTYMAAAGLKQVEETLSQELRILDPTQRTIDLAKDMMDIIEEFPGLKLKIGIHRGKPVMGVIGYHKPQFSLIGDVVNTTSRHCTTGEKGKIMISQAAFEQLSCFEQSFIQSRGYELACVKTEMKGKGKVNVHRLFKRAVLLRERLFNLCDRNPILRDPLAISDLKKLQNMKRVVLSSERMENFGKTVQLLIERKKQEKAKKKLIQLYGGDIHDNSMIGDTSPVNRGSAISKNSPLGPRRHSKSDVIASN